MKRSEQTEELKVRLYSLTRTFVHKYMHRYFKQFTGNPEDLIMEYYIEFETPKSREKGKEETLLDKWNSEITSLEYLVKVSVQRKLIDSSRQNPYNSIRLDNYIDDYGDCITKAFELTTEQDDEQGALTDLKVFTMEEARYYKHKFELLADNIKEGLYTRYDEMRSAILPAYRQLFDYVFSGYEADLEPETEKEAVQMYLEVIGVGDCLVQQVTSKTACVFIESLHKVVDFNRLTGAARGKQYSSYSLTELAINALKSIVAYHSGRRRDEMEAEGYF